ncbi:MAG: FtsW/RodA/SpoVE family cell cycle protein [Candidatus Neptunochlamydia sp.]|nr:FtsW/RodA/SpoVE family cell cycle protein [Candidatus Neptunochlamydia sp.]
MWNHQVLRRIDFRTLPLIMALMMMSILIIASTTSEVQITGEYLFFTPHVKNQIQRFGVGILCYLFFVGINYHKLREWAWVLYLGTILLLIGLFFTESIQHVHRWYRIPFVGGTLQPSEYAKLTLVFTLSWFLEKKGRNVGDWRTFFQAGVIVLMPFLLILKQPDLGSAMVLFPMTLGMFYFAGIRKGVIKIMSALGVAALILIFLIFTGVLDHEEIRPVATKVLKEYQYERFDPDTYHHQAAKTAIALGKYTGSGFKKSLFTGRQFLPAAHTDSVFPAFAEEFGIFGAIFMLLLFFGLIYCSFQVTAVARDHFGRALSAGISVYLAIHVVINIGMMCGFLPITGVPLVLVTYGGSSVTLTMSALGILQSIYTRRFMF